MRGSPSISHLAEVIEGIAEAVIFIDDSGTVVLANARAEELLCLERARIIGAKCDDPVFPLTPLPQASASFPDGGQAVGNGLPFKQVHEHSISLADMNYSYLRPGSEDSILLSVSAAPLRVDMGAALDGVIVSLLRAPDVPTAPTGAPSGIAILDVLYKISEIGLSCLKDQRSLADEYVQVLAEDMCVDKAVLFLPSERFDCLTVAAAVGLPAEALSIQIPFPADLTGGYVVPPELGMEPGLTHLWPLHANGAVLGLLICRWPEPRAFEGEDAAFFNAVVNQAALALERSALYQSLKKQLSHTALLQEMALAAGRSKGLEETAQSVLQVMTDSLDLHTGDIKILDPGAGVLHLVASTGFPDDALDILREVPVDSPGFFTARAFNENRTLTHEDDDDSPTRLHLLKRTGLSGTRYLVAPIRASSSAIGVFGVSFAGRRPFSPAEFELFDSIGGFIGQAMENAKLFAAEAKARDQAAAELEVSSRLLDTGTLLASSLDIGTVLECLADVVVSMTGCRRVVVSLLATDEEEMIVKAVVGSDRISPGTRISLSATADRFLWISIREKRSIVGDFEDASVSSEQKKLGELYDARKVLYVPLIIAGQVVGHIAVDDPGERRHFTDHDVRLVEGLAPQAAIAINNAQLYEAQKVSQARLATELEISNLVLEAADAINSTLELADLLDRFGDILAVTLGRSRVLVALLDAEKEELKVTASRGSRVPVGAKYQMSDLSSHFARAIRTKKTILADGGNMRFADGRMGSMEEDGAALAAVSPLVMEDRVIGLIAVDEPGDATPFSDRDLQIIDALGSQVASAIDRTNLLFAEKQARDEADRHASVNQSLLQAAMAISSSIELEEVNVALAKAVSMAVNRSRVGVMLMHPEHGELALVASVGESGAEPHVDTPIEEFAPGIQESILQMTPVVVHFANPSIAGPIRAQAMRQRYELALSVPMVSNNTAIGVVLIDEPGEVKPFTAQEIAVIEGIAAHAATAIENARLHGRSVARAHTFEAIAQMGTLLSAAMTFRETSDLTTKYLSLLLNADASTLMLADPASGDFRLDSSHNLEASHADLEVSNEELRVWDLESEAPNRLSELKAAGGGRFFERAAAAGYATAAAAPLRWSRGDLSGLLFVFFRDDRRFSDEEMMAFRLFATQASTALGNAERFDTEHTVADTLQRAILADPKPISGIRFGSIYRSATDTAKVGGDFYDVFAIDEDRVGLVIGDVAGKGIGAAALTATVRSTIRAYAFENHAPDTVMDRTNRAMKDVSHDSSFVTVLFGVLNLNTGIMTYCCAGHPPGVILRSTGDITTLRNTSAAIGISDAFVYELDRVQVHCGDLLVLYTDGSTEARRGDDFLGDEGLTGFIRGCGGLPAEEAPSHIYSRILEWTQGSLYDDVALLALSLDPGGSV